MWPSRITSTRSQMPMISGSSLEITTTPMPSLRQLVDDAVDLRLGADVDAAGRLVEDQHARLDLEQRDSSTFCWLPPDRLPTVDQRARPRGSRSAWNAASARRFAPWRDRARRPARASRSITPTLMFSPHGHVEEQAEPLAVLGQVGDAGVERILRAA